MKLKILWLPLLFCLFSFSLQAQDVSESGTFTIIDELESNNPSQGVIHIESDPAIALLIGSPVNVSGAIAGEQAFVRMTGYRVQVFSGNDPRRSKSEAFSKEKQIKDYFPETSTYVTYVSPNWRLRIGDFRTKEEAVVFMQNLKSVFPEFGKEMYTVVDKVKIPIDKSN